MKKYRDEFMKKNFCQSVENLFILKEALLCEKFVARVYWKQSKCFACTTFISQADEFMEYGSCIWRSTAREQFNNAQCKIEKRNDAVYIGNSLWYFPDIFVNKFENKHFFLNKY